MDIRATFPEGRAPRYATELAAGADLQALLAHPVTIPPGDRRSIPTGVSIELPAGYEAQIRPRSGLAIRHGVTMVNAPGTIDADYRGELHVLLLNTGRAPFTVHDGDRIGQMVIAPIIRATFVESDSLGDTERGSGGFGSTGR